MSSHNDVEADTMSADDGSHRRRRSYQTLLRAIGAFFDAAGAESVSVIEVGAGFVARFYAAESGPEMQSRRFSVEALMHEANAARRRSEAEGKGAKQERSYENVLRTLGWELDDVAAATITVEELPAEFYVSWLARSPEAGLVVLKRHATVGVEGLTSMLHDAEGRRRPGVLTTEAPGDEGAVSAQGPG